MYRYHRTSILKSNAQTVVNTVNTVGVMGKGLAAEFKRRYPDMFEKYKHFCQHDMFDIGQLWLWKSTDQWVLNFPTKKHWRNPSKIEYIEAGLKNFTATYEQRGITEIAFPRLGCGNGGLEWSVVGPLMEHYLGRLPIQIYVHDYNVDIGAPEHIHADNNDNDLRSFDVFMQHIEEAVTSSGESLETFSNRSKFSAAIDENENVVFFSSGGRKTVSKDDVLELWHLLIRGPVTRKRLAGPARDAAYYLFPLLSHLPSIRPFQIGSEDNVPAMAIEFKGNKKGPHDIHAQDELEWA